MDSCYTVLAEKMVLFNFLFGPWMQPHLLVTAVKTFRCTDTQADCCNWRRTVCEPSVLSRSAERRVHPAHPRCGREHVDTSCLSACVRSLTCILRRWHPTRTPCRNWTRLTIVTCPCAGTRRFSALGCSCAALASPRPMTCHCVTNGFGSKMVTAGRGFCKIQFISVFWHRKQNAPLACRWTALEKNVPAYHLVMVLC